MGSKKRLRWLIFLATLYLMVCVVGGVYLGDGTLRPARRPLSDEEAVAAREAVKDVAAEFEDVSVTAGDGAVLRGWLLSPAQANGSAALLLHGLGDNRLGMVGYARLLLGHGYAVLLPDARAHGVSGGSLATYGLLERDDIRQWVGAIDGAVHPGCVYGLGESMGGAQLLQSLDAGAPFCAVVAESSFANFREIAYDRMGQPFGLGPWVGRWVLRPLVEVAFLRARWKNGMDMESVSPEAAAARTEVPVLLIHGMRDTNIPVRHSREIHAVAPRTLLWEVAGADHCEAMRVTPAEFENRVVGWFGKSPSVGISGR